MANAIGPFFIMRGKGSFETNNEIYFSQESERKNPQVKMIQQNISKNDSSCPHKKRQRHFKETESLLQ